MSTALQWFKSSYSSEQGGQCLEVAYRRIKSSYSTEQGGACLEIAAAPSAIHIRDSKNPRGAHLTVSPDAWAAFLALPRT
ncbi:DUF397 domain-containing protein [Streptomyces sp. NPDC017940]|uniref:DUF397 domain-containing protein n=1 Tax=Streptomyces sp. NPDC017940 TaxID=3365017 RepID=UPI00379AED59